MVSYILSLRTNNLPLRRGRYNRVDGDDDNPAVVKAFFNVRWDTQSIPLARQWRLVANKRVTYIFCIPRVWNNVGTLY